MPAAHGIQSRATPGLPRIIEHFEAIARVTNGEPAPARRRLESQIGSELAHRLVGALARRPGGPRGALPL